MSNVPVVSGDARANDPLLEAVNRLAVRVETLDANAFSKEDAKRSRRRTLFLVLAMVLIAQVISLGTFVTVASGCFIRTTPPKPGSTLRTVCGWIPGYDESQRMGQKNLEKFQQSLEQIPKNAETNKNQDAEIARLKARVARLEHH